MRLRLGKKQTHSIETENTFYRENTFYKRTKSRKRTHSLRLRLGMKQTNKYGDLYVGYRDEDEGTHALENTFYSENKFCLCVVW